MRRIYITGLGLYKLWINGKVVGNDLLTPGWTRFSTRVQYQIYDITDFLVEGKNAIGVTFLNKNLDAGTCSYDFDASSINLQLSSGRYFYRLESAGYSRKKMIRIK